MSAEEHACSAHMTEPEGHIWSCWHGEDTQSHMVHETSRGREAAKEES